MTSGQQQQVIIDATAPEGRGLLSVLSETLYAANPQRQGIGKVTLFVPCNDTTDWPEASWLEIKRLQTGNSADDNEQAEGNLQYLEQYLAEHPKDVLLALNSLPNQHPVSMVLVGDAMAASLGSREKPDGLLQRIRSKVLPGTTAESLQNATALLGLSCFSIAQLVFEDNSYAKKINILPMGIAPQFFNARKDHRLIDALTTQSPFTWLAKVSYDRIEETAAVIEAIRILRDFGLCVELNLLLPDTPDGNGPGKEVQKQLDKVLRNHQFGEILDASDIEELAAVYHAADGFIWGSSSDYDHQFMLYAMASGLPVVAASSEMVKKHLGQKTRFFIPYDENDLANTLERSMADIHFRIIGGARNHKRSMSYTWEKTAAELFRLMRAYGEPTGENEALAS